MEQLDAWRAAGTPREYIVRFAMQVNAKSPREAAEIVAAMLCGHTTTHDSYSDGYAHRAMYEVSDNIGEYAVDLELTEHELED